tara:strand:- start:3090 stop:3545 length:456 start_codon:yes stop_codon:yes gene_type:complete
MRLLLIALLLLTNVCFAQSQHDLYPFNDAKQQALFDKILPNLRCLVCQNESLMESNAPLAQDLRGDVYRQVKSGKSEHDIMQYLTTRYGDFILFKPRVDSKTYILWFGPFVLLGFGLVLVIFIALRRKSIKPIVLSKEQQQRAEKLLREAS